MRLPRRHWAEMTTKDFADSDTSKWVAALPVGAVEQHGPHLPVETDALINAGVVKRTIEILPDDVPATFLPMIAAGKSNEHIAYPGTLTFSAETLIRIWTELGESVARAGVRRLLIFNSHGGQPQVAEIVARDLRVRLGMLVAVISTYQLAKPPLWPREELKYGIHAGGVETSIVKFLRGDLVREDEIRNFEPLQARVERDFPALAPDGRLIFAWQSQDLNPHGASGDARDSDPKRGGEVVELYAKRLVDVLSQMARFDISFMTVRDRPGA
jgi:creatinine amidohydrolase